MSSICRKLIFLFIITLCLLLTVSCWNRREVEELAIVVGGALDTTDEQGKIEITAQIIKPGQLDAPITTGGGQSGGNGGGGGSPGPFFNVKAQGETVFQTIRGMTHVANRKLFWPHNRVLIYGEDLARNGISKYLDFFLRDHEPYPTAWIIISKGKAAPILELKPSVEKVMGLELGDLIEAQAANSQTVSVDVHDFAQRLMSKTTAPIAPIVEIRDLEGRKIPYVYGTAVFKTDRLTGYLNSRETRGLLWVLGKIRSGIITIPCGEGNNGAKTSLEIIKSTVSMTPQIKGEEIHIIVKVEILSDVGEQMCLEDLTKTSVVEDIQKRGSAAVAGEIKAALEKAQSLNTDIFGFGEAVHRADPRSWKDLEKRWDELFPELDVTLEIELNLRRTGTTLEKPNPQ